MQKTFTTIVRLPKQDSSILYFTLEANENLVFYSTLKSSLHQGYRDIRITGTVEFKEDLDRLLDYLKGKITLEIITET